MNSETEDPIDISEIPPSERIQQSISIRRISNRDLEQNRQQRSRCPFSGCNYSTENNAALIHHISETHTMSNKNFIFRSVIALLLCLAISMIFILVGANSHLQNEINDLKDHAEHLNDIISYQNIQINYMKYKLRGLELIFEDKELLFLSLMKNNIHKSDLLIDIKTNLVLYNVEDVIQNLKNLLTSIKYKGIAEIFTLREERAELISNLTAQKYEKAIEMYYQIYQHEEILGLREEKSELISNLTAEILELREEKSELISNLTAEILGLREEKEQLVDIIKKNEEEYEYLRDEYIVCKNTLSGMTEYEIIFWSVNEYGILGWIEQGGSYVPSLLRINSGYRHYKGEYNPDGYYVVGSTSGHPIVYNMKTAQVHKVYSGNVNNVYDCAWQNTTHFVCCDSDEDALFYEMSTTNSLSKWSPGGDDKKAIIVLISGDVVVGDKDSDLDIKTATNSYSSNTANEDDVYGLVEVRPNMVISAEDDQLYLHNFTTPTDIRRTKLENDASDRYRSIAKLNATGEFAFGAKKDSKPYIEIKRLNTDNSTTPIKTYRFAASSYGYVYTLYELSNGFLLIGGDFDKICTWRYKDTPAVNPVCYNRGINSKVVGFIPGSGFKYYLEN